MKRTPRSHPEWVLMADAGVPVATIAKLNEVPPAYVSRYVRQRGETLRGGPAPARLLLHDRPRPRPARRADPDRCWRARLEELEAFLDAHQRRPHAAQTDHDRALGSEWSLAHWLKTQRSEHRTGRLPLHRQRQLDGVLPSWRLDDRSIDTEAIWRLRLVELLRFHREHGRLPARSETPGAENSLAAWVRKQHNARLAGTLDPERSRWLDLQIPGLRLGL